MQRLQTSKAAAAFPLTDWPQRVQAVWKPDETTMRRMTATPSGAFGCLCGHHRDDEKASLS
ncbi:hypothetical protein, partial [Paraburkholderia strydomiana]|uniref:hypothetical protein n=1 Tax=Paraburkholderia strydomiana TaxID=1245417 RepID=UPI0038B6D1A4